MATGLLIGVALAGALACPLMLLLGRLGIGPGCVLGRCGAAPDDSEQGLRARQQELAARIAELETEQTQRLPSPR